jgi:hypothetical protein
VKDEAERQAKREAAEKAAAELREQERRDLEAACAGQRCVIFIGNTPIAREN